MKLPFQKIYEQLETVLPEKWDKVILLIVYEGDSYTMKFYVFDQDEIIDCYDLQNTSAEELRTVFSDIDDLIYPVREKIEPKDLWNAATIIVKNTGKMKCYFDYFDDDESFIDYYKIWKQKYLKNTAKKKHKNQLIDKRIKNGRSEVL